ncbi:MAG: DNA mismatch repair protein MutS, partial [Planctomycetota bacterium]
MSEILVSEKSKTVAANEFSDYRLTTRPDWSFGAQHTRDLLLHHFDVATFDGFGIEEEADRMALRAAGAILQYVKETQSSSLKHVDKISCYRPEHSVQIDRSTWQSLEISHTARSGSQDGSLFSVVNRCVSPMGARQLGEWLTQPLRDVKSIELRQDAVGEFAGDSGLRGAVRERLKNVYDLQRLVGRITSGRCGPRDLNCIGRTLAALPSLKAKLTDRKSEQINELEARIDLCTDLRAELDKALDDPCTGQLKDGGFIKSGYHVELDGLRKLASGGKQWIANYQKTICETTGIPSLKVGFNKVFGYYLEVTNTHKEKVPAEFIRKQTLKNAERYITPELKEYEEKVLSADEKAVSLEQELFAGLRELVRSHANRLKDTAENLAILDALCGLGQLAATESYCRPEMSDDNSLLIVDGRHPVLDVLQPTGVFIPNSTAIDEEAGFVHLITGPNMAGKSTYIRQVALITLLAQIGSFVPAKEAKIGVVDRIFARIGASDELSRGQSTFMVEMTETARILNTASSRSLVVLDEIGRGTSTYDGVSLAWSIVEYIHDHIGCRTLFATHYHELTELENNFSGVANFNVSVQEWDEKIVFLHKIIAGAANKSYGIHVSQLAGVPPWVSD